MFSVLLINKLLGFIINYLFYRERKLLPFFTFLKGKILQIELVELNLFLVFIFCYDSVKVLHVWNGATDCSIRVNNIFLLFDICTSKYPIESINKNVLEVIGNIQLFQQLMLSVKMMDIDVVDFFIPWCNSDLIIEICRRLIIKKASLVLQLFTLIQNWIVIFVTQNWQLVPTSKEVFFFYNEMIQLQSMLKRMLIDLRRLEDDS